MIIKLKKQKGFSAIIAVVLIVLFALMGTYMATLSTIGSLNTTQSLGSMQAWFAVKSGLDWAVHDALQNSAASLNCGGAGPGFTLGGGAANNFDIQVTCNTTSFTEAGTCTPCITYALTIFAERGNQGDMTYVSRTLRASVTDAP
jgi:hypothetical protein